MKFQITKIIFHITIGIIIREQIIRITITEKTEMDLITLRNQIFLCEQIIIHEQITFHNRIILTGQ